MNIAVEKLIDSNVLKSSESETTLLGTEKVYCKMATGDAPHSFHNCI